MRKVSAAVLSLLICWAAYADGAEVRELVAKLKNKDSDVRRAAAKELSELGEGAKDAVAALSKAMTDKDLFVRRFSAEALGNIGPAAKAAVPALSAALGDEKKEVQLAAVEALGKMGPDSLQALHAALKDTSRDSLIRKQAALGIGKIGLPARSTVSTLTDILNGKVKMAKGTKGKGNDDDIRVEVATALGKVAKAEDKFAVEALKSVSEGKQRNKALQKAASDAIREITGVGAKKKKK